jgi:hypothetical protein
MHVTRRSVLTSLATAAVFRTSVAASSPKKRPLIGAIRWDAWYSPGSSATAAVEESLNPAQYRWRFPFFAQEGPGKVYLPPISQELIDLEIKQAAYAGIDFWAFAAYSKDSGLSIALKYHLASTIRSRVQFCMFTSLEYWGTKQRPSDIIREHLHFMQESNYARVDDGRPLYILGFIDQQKVSRLWGGYDGLKKQILDFRSKASDLGLRDPYLVLTGGVSELSHWSSLGGDAISAYSIAYPRGSNSYTVLAQTAENTWRTLSTAGLPVIPTVMAGWDRRPRVDHPVPWETYQKRGIGLNDYYDQPTAAELATHLRQGINFALSQREKPVPAVLIYAWNENDEGGWLVPTAGCNEEHLRAVRSVAHNSDTSPDPGCEIVQLPK